MTAISIDAMPRLGARFGLEALVSADTLAESTDELAEARKGAESYARALARSLQTELHVTLVVAGSGDLPKGHVVLGNGSVEVDAVLRLPDGSASRAGSLQRSLEWLIHDNRHLLTSEEGTALVLQQLLRPTEVAIDLNSAEAVSRRALERGLALGRLDFSGERGAPHGHLPSDLVPSVQIHMGEELHRAFMARDDFLLPGADQGIFPALFDDVCHQLYSSLGVRVGVTGVIETPSIGPYDFRFRWNDVITPAFHGAAREEALVEASGQELALIGLEVRTMLDPRSGLQGAIFDQSIDDEPKSLSGSLRNRLSPLQYVARSLEHSLSDNAAQLVSSAVLTYDLWQLRAIAPRLVHAAEHVDEGILLGTLRCLLQERVGTRNLRRVLEAVVEHELAPDVTEFGEAVRDYVEAVRMKLREQIFAQRAPGGLLGVLRVDPETERALLAAPSASTQRARLAFLDAIDRNVRTLGSSTSLVLATSPSARRPIWELVMPFTVDLAVLSDDEIAGKSLQVYATIDVDEASSSSTVPSQKEQ